MTLKYTTKEKFLRFFQTVQTIPNRQQSTFPAKEVVGIGDDSETIFYFDVGNVVEDSETLYYGASEAAATSTLTETTHYTVDYDKGIITLTGAGVTLLSTNNIYATYSYNINPSITDTYLGEVLHNAEAEIDKRVNSLFYDSSAATPDFGEITNEIHEGQGKFQKYYTLDKYPVNGSTTTLNGAVSADDGTITVVSTDGFPSSGYIFIETDKIAYTGKTTTTFTGCTSVLAHDDGETVTSFGVEVSLDDEGNSPSWEVKEYQVGYDIDFDSGNIRLNDVSVAGTTVMDNFHPPIYVWNRIRINYQYGYTSIPNDIIRCVHLIAGMELFSGQVLNAVSRGTDGFSTDSLNDVQKWIDRTIAKYKAWKIKNIQP